MKISSKSILSPGRSRDPAPISLSSSLSRRLRPNGSLKGQASPMFPAAAGKKKGCSFENPEPSSPKVTCIGQVRVKTKKQGKKMRSRSRRRPESSFRRVDSSAAGATPCDGGQISRSYSQSHFNQQQEVLSQRNQRWVHLPMTICEALRAFGSDLNCFLPCRSSCLSSGNKAEKPPGSAAGEGGGCGAAFARWLVAVQDGEGKGREIELVVGGGEEELGSPELCRSQRRHVFEDIDIGLEMLEEKQSKVVVAEEEGTEEPSRVSVCVPPKNALLLMRCRSDPVKMAALANRFWESPLRKEDEEERNEDEVQETENCEEEEAEAETVTVQLETEHREDADPEEKEEKPVLALGDETVDDLTAETVIPEEKPDDLVSEEEKITEIENLEAEVSSAVEDCNREEQNTEVVELELEETVLSDSTPPEDLMVIEELEIEETAENLAPEVEEDVDVEENRASVPSSPFASVQSDPESEPEPDPDSENSKEEEEKLETEPEPAIEAQVPATMAEPETETEESTTEAEMEESRVEERSEPEPEPEPEPGRRSNDSVSKRLPDCLLLMMCEPKLSMEVSKETWVCSTDFIRRLPDLPPQVNKTNAPDHPIQLTSTGPTLPPPHQIKPSLPNPLHQPPRSSCSFPAPAKPSPDAAGSAAAYEPLALKRCKSEPMRSASKLAHPDAAGCFWNSRRLEPHRPEIGATGF